MDGSSRCTSSRDFCWLIVFLGLTKHHFWRRCWWFVLYEALYLWTNQLLKKKSTFHGDSENWTPKTLACGYLAVPKVIGSYGSCSAKVAAWLFGGGMRLGSRLYDPEFVVVVVCTTRWCFFFTPTWGRFPFWLIFFQMGWNHQLD